MHLAGVRPAGVGEGQVEKGLCDIPRGWALSSSVGQQAVKGFQSGQDMSDQHVRRISLESVWRGSCRETHGPVQRMCLAVTGRSDRVQHKNRDREEGMEWKDHQEQGELIKLEIVA